MEIVLGNKDKISLDEKSQERMRLIEDGQVEKEYLSLKQQLTTFRR